MKNNIWDINIVFNVNPDNLNIGIYVDKNKKVFGYVEVDQKAKIKDVAEAIKKAINEIEKTKTL